MMSQSGQHEPLSAQHLHGDMITAENGGDVVRVSLGVEGGDSTSCREEERKWRAVVFVAIEPHPQRHDGSVLITNN